MNKNIIKYILIYITSIIFIGCEYTLPLSNESCDYCYLVVEAPDLVKDENGIYQLDFNNNELQTFTQLRVYVGYEMEFVEWTTNVTFESCTWGHCESVPIVNGTGYSTEDGYAYQMMGVYEENIGDIATIWVGYFDNYENQWVDSIRIKINE